jgi:hypothetical protein
VTGKEQLIIELWTEMGKESAGAAELELIQQSLRERLGPQGLESPASIARTLADHGARLQHPEILIGDVSWREREVFCLFSPEELEFTTLEAAVAWVEKVGHLHQQFQLEENQLAVEQLRQFVLQIKSELELIAGSKRVALKERELASEVAQWLVVWLQNPAIFTDWLALRRQSVEFQARFGS